MRAGTEKTLYKKFLSKKIRVDHVCEVGVWLPEMSNILDFIVRDKVRRIGDRHGQPPAGAGGF